MERGPLSLMHQLPKTPKFAQENDLAQPSISGFIKFFDVSAHLFERIDKHQRAKLANGGKLIFHCPPARPSVHTLQNTFSAAARPGRRGPLKDD